MMGRQDRDQRQLFYEFSLDEMIPTDHLLRRIDVFATAVLADLHEQLKAFYSDGGRPSVDPELMIRMLLVGQRLDQHQVGEVLRDQKASRLTTPVPRESDS
jgi:transposase